MLQDGERKARASGGAASPPAARDAHNYPGPMRRPPKAHALRSAAVLAQYGGCRLIEASIKWAAGKLWSAALAWLVEQLRPLLAERPKPRARLPALETAASAAPARRAYNPRLASARRPNSGFQMMRKEAWWGEAALEIIRAAGRFVSGG